MTTPLFHIGFPKSGSTTIQDILSTTPGLGFLGKPYRSPAVERLIRYTLPYGDLRQFSSAEIARMRQTLAGENVIVSDEILSGLGFAHTLAANSILAILDNIDRLTGSDFRAVVLLRRPHDFLRSFHGQLVKMGARLSMDQFCSLVLLRREFWVFRGLNYLALMRAPIVRSGQLRVLLFEDVFASPQAFSGFMATFGVTTPGLDPAVNRANVSLPDTVTDFLGAKNPDMPAAWFDMRATLPSHDEIVQINHLPVEDRALHLPLWQDDIGRLDRDLRAQGALAGSALANLGMHLGKRPTSAAFQRLLAEIAAVNAGIDDEFPEIGFARQRYF